jgi:hypothetical protein
MAYLECVKNAWLKLYKGSELADFFTFSPAEQSRLDKGNLAELWARKLFPAGILIEKSGDEAALLTAMHIEQRTPVLFQSTFFHDAFMVRNDVLAYNADTQKWNLYEIKSKSSLDEIDHVEDATFQAIVLKECGIELENVFIVHLNKDYIRTADVDVKELFVLNNVTDKVKAREEHTKERMLRAKIDLSQDKEESLACQCLYNGRSAHCKTFSYSYPRVPNISVHDIARISTKKLQQLIDSNILNIDEVPSNFTLTEIQQKQVNAYKFKTPIFNAGIIEQELNKLTYPLYFLDYESYSHPVPLYNGFKPWQQVPFQFSLQVIANDGAEPVTFGYLHEADSDPSEVIIQKLIELIGSTGSVVVWHKSFEQMINNQLGERHPEHKAFLQNLNDRCFDLEEIFTKQHYVDPLFNGKTSIKNVLPALIPDLSYGALSIQSGDVASEKWFNMITGEVTTSEKVVIAKELKNYCNLDTYAMYKIKQFLLSIQP